MVASAPEASVSVTTPKAELVDDPPSAPWTSRFAFAVVTVAGVLDAGAWTHHHGYQRLFASLDPALQPPLDPDIAQYHLMGGRDIVTPVSVMRPAAERMAPGSVRLYAEYDHGCCWARNWEAILAEMPER